MALVQMVMPKMGESIMEGTILNWLKKVGDRIEQDESVLEVATDKVDTEVPSTHAGVLKEILVEKGQVVAVGAPIAVISTGGDDDTASNKPSEVKQEVKETPKTPSTQTSTKSVSQEHAKPSSGKFYSPLVLNIAKQENISMSELEDIDGSGK